MASSFDLPRAVVLCIPRLYGGGAEKVMALMAGWWVARGVHVYLITFRTDPDDLPLHPGVRRILLKDYSVQDAPVIPEWPQESCNIYALRHALLDILHKECDMACLPVVSFLTRMNMRCLLAVQDLPCHIVISERIYPPAVFLGEHDEALRKSLYPQADALVVQTDYAKTHWGTGIVSSKKCHVITNPIILHHSTSKAEDVFFEHNRYFLAIGRLTVQKRHDLLLRAFARLIQIDPLIHLYIAGTGEQEHFLRLLCKELKLENNVNFLGHVHDTSVLLRHALALVHTSDFEGFPNTLLEALAEGCPIISTDCPTGPREIVQHQKNGFLVPVNNQFALTQAMVKVLDETVQHTFRTCDRAFLEKFNEEAIMQSWTRLLKPC